MRKVLRLAVLASVIITATAARAEIFGGNDCGENCSWSLDTQTGVFIINGEGAMKNYAWDAVPWPRSLIYSVQISDGITSIGDNAFLGSHLTSIDIPNTVTKIGNNAFMGNELISITIPNSVTSIGVQAFRGNDFETVNVPDAVIYIGGGAFAANANLTEITISPEQLTANRPHVILRDALPISCAQGEFSQAYCDEAQAYFDKNPDINSYGFSVSIFDNTDISNLTINCRGEISACQAAMEYLNYGTGVNQKGTYKLGQKQTDGSSKIFESSGKVYYKNKRIYTIDEANEVAGKTNHVKIKYR